MPREKFCPNCGRKTEKFYDSLCEDCFRKTVSFADDVPQKVVIRTCTSCGKIYIEGKGFETTEKAIEDFLADVFKKRELDSVSYRLDGNRVIITINSKVKGVEKSEEIERPLMFKNIVCRYCALKQSSYFNTIIQIRAPKNLEEEVIKDFEEKMSEVRRGNNYAFISSIKRLPEGVDIYVGSSSAAEKVIRELKSKYKITTKVSHKISGLEQGKKTYRDTILVRVEE